MFYKNLASIYQHIFPAKGKASFINSQLAAKSRLLDVGCADGRMSRALADHGHRVDGFDLSAAMVNVARRVNAANDDVSITQLDMLKTAEYYRESYYDAVLCVGNTLVHLADVTELNDAIAQFHHVLVDNGLLIIQILNYDYIYQHNITELPLIKNNAVTFRRHYSLEQNRVIFSSQIELPSHTKTLAASTELLPIRPRQLDDALSNNDFQIIKRYGSFAGQPFNARTLPYIVIAKKTI